MGKNPHGYHLLDSMVMFARDLYDEIEIEKSQTTHITVTGPWKKNLVGTNILQTTLDKFSSLTYLPQFNINITKNIPIGAGLGGGSGNAAALIRHLIDNYLPDLPLNKIVDLCVSIGADVTACFYSRSLYFNGIGEIISPIQIVPDLYAVIIYPNLVISTREIFSSGFQVFHSQVTHFSQFENYKQFWHYLAKTDNQLFNNIRGHKAILNLLIKSLSALENCKIARMTGSGSACFALFENKESAFLGASTLQKKFPEYPIYTTKLM